MKRALAELRILGEVKSTPENVRWAMATEEREFQDIYGRFLQQAREEGNQELAAVLGHILAVERGHHNLFGEALAAYDKFPGHLRTESTIKPIERDKKKLRENLPNITYNPDILQRSWNQFVRYTFPMDMLHKDHLQLHYSIPQDRVYTTKILS